MGSPACNLAAMICCCGYHSLHQYKVLVKCCCVKLTALQVSLQGGMAVMAVESEGRAAVAGNKYKLKSETDHKHKVTSLVFCHPGWRKDNSFFVFFSVCFFFFFFYQLSL